MKLTHHWWLGIFFVLLHLVSANSITAVEIKLERVGSFHLESVKPSACEIVRYDPGSKRAFVTSAAFKAVLILDMSQPTAPKEVGRVDVGSFGSPNSVAVHQGRVAIAVEANDKTQPGEVWLVDAGGSVLSRVKVGAQPDMILFSPDGSRVLTADEGEPSDDGTSDPEGSISILDLPPDLRTMNQSNVCTADFRALDLMPKPEGVVTSPQQTQISRDLEPEYIAISQDGKRAFVSLQENNALAIVDVEQAKILSVRCLGFKDHSQAGRGLDASDKAEEIEIREWPVYGLYQPDALICIHRKGRDFLISANEGDERVGPSAKDAVRVSDLKLDTAVFIDHEALQKKTQLGRLRVSQSLGDVNGDGLHEKLFSFGGRSISVWDADGAILWDSGDEFERTMAKHWPDQFNSDHEKDDSRKSRSDARGPEPEALAYGEVEGVPLVFVGLERASAVLSYDLSDPLKPRLVGSLKLRNHDAALGTPEAGDSGPEGLDFIPGKESPNGKPLLLVASEISNTVSVFEVSLLK